MAFRRQSLLSSAGTIAAFLMLSSLALADDRPNVVLILADDLGYGDIGVHGCEDIPTPNIDEIAALGVRCTNGYSPHPFCSPARAALMTGRYQHRFGYETNIPFDPQNEFIGLPTDQTTIAERLQQAGYRTGMVGKWHLGAGHPFHPTRRGFDFFYGFLGGGHRYFDIDVSAHLHEGYLAPLHLNTKPATFEGYLTNALTDWALEFIVRQKKNPFFLYVAYNAPHTPMEAPEETIAKFSDIKDEKRRIYAAMVYEMDRDIGRILDSLEEHGLRENTFVAFLSDNGGPEPSNGSNNGPLRGIKGEVYEGGIRVPFLLSWPARLPAGSTYDEPVIGFDISCTALELAGADVSDPDKLDGVNLIPYLTGEKSGSPHAALFWRKRDGEGWAVRQGDRKLLLETGTDAPQLYNLEDDLSEENDLADDSVSRVNEFKQRFDGWNRHNQPNRFPDFRSYHPAVVRFYRSMITQ